MDSKVSSHKPLIYQYALIGMIAGLGFTTMEYFVKLGTDDEQILVPLLIRGLLAGLLVCVTAVIFEIKSKQFFAQRPFIFAVGTRSVIYTLIISFWLAIINGIWMMILRNFTFLEGLSDYLRDQMFILNLVSIYFLLAFLIGSFQINSLHKKGELWKYITGKYHTPREVNRIFCFVDLKGSTTIAENLGNYQFASFLKDYYSDITDALRKTNAEIYQYVGDEIVLTWPLTDGIRNVNALECLFLMDNILAEQKDKYLRKYSCYPDFRAGVHGGPVIVTWVGEIKKEIVFIGDVLNTTSRIQSDCKRLGRDVLISKELLDQFSSLPHIDAVFIEETIPRGKAKGVKLYSLTRKSN